MSREPPRQIYTSSVRRRARHRWRTRLWAMVALVIAVFAVLAVATL